MEEIAPRPRSKPRLLRLLARFAGQGDYPRLARSRRFEWHLRRVLPRLQRLEAGANSNAVALLAVESFVRPRPVRIAEYCIWALASFPARPWLGTLSVGIAQAQLGNWQRLGVVEEPSFSVRRMRRVSDAEANYRVCLRLLEASGVADSDSAAELARVYTGAAGTPYADLVLRARQSIAVSPNA